ncbi:hypothetical protein PYW08_008491 [Mythimna loreyi]|uniref:Uncharacterized protein n=1 Tax=Mythimna loreyi TaxID=667449 RepID=A0ACC2QCR3_9NEOP|nr:hypothetical protein PYW08_008491 [Mythimna loreyi]
MSHTVVRGKPTAAQLYMDGVLDAILLEQGVTPDPNTRGTVTFPQIMLHCLKERPNDEFMTNGATGEVITNDQHLRHAISLARALTAQGAKGKYGMLLMRNHQDTAAIYFASMFSGMISFMMDPNTTVYELTHFLKLIEPSYIFYDQEYHEILQEAREGCPGLSSVTVMADQPGTLKQFTQGYSDEVKGFEVPPADIDDAVLLLPTSGSTGIPKAAILTNRVLVTQVTTPWTYHTRFPTPTARTLVLTSIQWVTFTMFVTTSVAHHIPIVMTPKKITPEHVIELMEKYRPTWAYLSPSFAVSLLAQVRPDQMSSIETMFLLGSPSTLELMLALLEKLPKNCHLCDGFGTTETHGLVAIPDREAPQKSNGRLLNFVDYKLVDDSGQELVGPNQTGELWIKSSCTIKGYLKNRAAFDETFTPEGWYMTGDVFHLDENYRISFAKRKKFSFKFKGSQVAPEEVERVIGSVPGVHESVVCYSENGPVAAVVLVPGADVTREDINKAVDAALSDHKRLHGGIAFVTSLPHTHSDKLKRNECSETPVLYAMSHAVVRGKPSASQLYVDGVLDDILLGKGVKPDPTTRATVTFPQIMLHCLKERPNDEFMTNGATGEVITNDQLLRHAITLARSLTAQGAKGKYGMLLMRNHQGTAAIYFASMFSGMIPFMMSPNTTAYELTHFLKLIEPSFIFYDEEFHDILQEALEGCPDLLTLIVISDQPDTLKKFAQGYSDEVEGFEVASADIDDCIMLLPTSGSTGLPKAAIMTHRGLVAQLATPWMYRTQFPTPTARTLILTTIEWVTFTMFLTACVAYHIPIVMTPRKVTAEHVAELMEKYRPTWAYLSPSLATSLTELVRPDQISSIETLILLGSPATPELMATLRKILPKNCHLCDGYGTTETQGFIAIPDREAPLKSNGWPFNIMYYKLVDDSGQELVGPNQTGELWIKSSCTIKGYLKNRETYDKTFTPEGWYRTGDVFYLDENYRISFVIRKKFSFKFRGCQVAPEEVERVISSLPGVHESVVSLSDKGPVAAVVLVPGADVTREQINEAVDATLSDHKRLHGGIAFVTSLPHTQSGKLKRNECSTLIADLLKKGECY